MNYRKKQLGLVLQIAWLFCLCGCQTTTPTAVNFFDQAEKVILKKEGPEEFLYWEFKDGKELWSLDLGSLTDLKLYQDSMQLALGDQGYKDAVLQESVQNLDLSELENVKDGDRINALLVHTGSIGKIRGINRLESEILNYQISRFPMFSQPTEFHAFIARHEAQGKIRVYFGASNTEWPPRPTALIKHLESERANGWKLFRHLHNHYCKKDKNYVGILAPSLADAQYFKMLKERFNLDIALITNGIHTVEVESKDFGKLKAHGEE